MPLHLLQKGLKLSHLRLMAALASQHRIGEAADQVGITRPAASRLMSEIEHLTNQPMHQRVGRGIVLTDAGLSLARRAARIIQEIDSAGRELDEMQQGRGGHVRIGAVTGAALDKVLPALAQLPDLRSRVEVATSDVLANMILDGELDFALSRLPDGFDPDMFDFTAIGSEPVTLLVRQGHPLLSVQPTPQDMLQFPWILPQSDAILRQAVEAQLKQQGLPLPDVPLETSSFLVTITRLRQSDAIAPVGVATAADFAGAGMPIRRLPETFGFALSPYGIVTQAGAVLTPAAARVRQAMLAAG